MELSATHSVINVPELRCKIFTELSSPFEFTSFGDVHQNQLALLAAATSCKTLSTTALDVLWEDMSSLGPLLSLIGLRKKRLLNGRRSYTLPSTRVDSLQWSKMMCYGARIRHLIVDGDPDDFIHFHLFTLVKGRPLTPKLKLLYFPWRLSLVMFIPPTLKSLELFQRELDFEHLPESLGVLHKMAPSLEHLEFTGYPPEWGSIYELLGQFKHLRSLRWSGRGIENEVLSGIETLFSLPLLTELSLPLPKSEIKLVPAMNAFTSINLRVLTITRGSSAVIGDVLDCLRHIPLTSLHIYYSDLSPEQERLFIVQRWTSRISHLSPWMASTRSLSLSDGIFPLNRNPTEATREISFLRPLLDFHLLKNFSFRGVLSFDLSDGDLHLMAAAWPSMETLTLQNLHDVPSTQATFTSLQSFANHCPKLREISINLDIFAPAASFMIGHHGLHIITLNSTCRLQEDENILQTSRNLDAIFPSLQVIRGFGMAHDAPWRKVNRILEVCRAAREDERARYALG